MTAQGPDLEVTVLENREILPGVHSMVFRTHGNVYADSLPGQFLQVEVSPGPFPVTRRPLTIDGLHGDDCVRVVFESVGSGTSMLAFKPVGTSLRILGPLGRGYELRPGGWLLIGGGLGAAGLGFLASRIDCRSVLLGAATSSRLLPLPGLPVLTATEDGSRGTHGLVTDLLGSVEWTAIENVAVCGPVGMMDAVIRQIPERLLGMTQVSTEARMGCGYGVCEGCSLPAAAGGYLKCCTDGPVIPAADIDWERWRGGNT